jgi:hypothetical protein
MFRNFFLRRAERRRELRGQLVDTLLHRLERENSLVADDKLIARMGVSRRVFFQVVYSLVIQERMHMMTDSEGDIVLMTNNEYHRFMLRRSGMRETEIRRRQNIPVFMQSVAEQAIPAAEEDTVVVDTVSAEPAASYDSSDLGWFRLEVAPAAAAREKLPAARQSLPSRQRDPWLAGDIASGE